MIASIVAPNGRKVNWSFNRGVNSFIYSFIHSFIYSFIHSFKDLYSTSSRKLLRGASDSSTVKKNSFQLNVSESVLGRRRSAGGRLFHTVGATTEQARLCMILCGMSKRDGEQP